MSKQPSAEASERIVSGYVFGAPATLAGVCVTLIGVLKAIEKLGDVSTLADDLLTLDATAFALACLLSYSALRSGRSGPGHLIERAANIIFLAALCLLVVTGGLLTYEFI